MKITISVMFLFLLSCGQHKEKVTTVNTVASDATRAQLRDRYDLYLEGLKSRHQGPAGFILSEACDSLLFTGLVAATVPDIAVDLTAARDAGGAWHRRPLSLPECYPEFSGSSISRDMLVGVLWYAWRTKRLDIAEQLLSYGHAHGWVMGAGPYSRTYVMPGLQSTIAEVVYRLGGHNDAALRSFPQVYGDADGYELHLQVLLILLRGELTGNIGDWALEKLQTAFTSNQRNALYAYAHAKWVSGDYAPAYAALADANYFPPDRLPSTKKYCAEWLWQRDLGADWQPCPSENSKEHSGADWLFVYGLLAEGK